MRNSTCHWQWKYWRPEYNKPFEPLTAAGTNVFLQRGVKPGDRLYIVTLTEGILYLGGRITVARIVNRPAAVRRTGNSQLYEYADEWALGDAKEGTLLHLQRKLAPELTERIRFRSPNEVSRLHSSIGKAC